MKKYIIPSVIIFLVTVTFSCEQCNPSPPPIIRDSIIKGEWINVYNNFPNTITCLFSDFEEYPYYNLSGLLYIGTDNGLYTYNDTIVKKITNFTGKVYSIERYKENIFIAMSDVFYNDSIYKFAILEINKNNQVQKIHEANDTIYALKSDAYFLYVGGVFDTIDNKSINKLGYLMGTYWDTIPNLKIQKVGQIFLPADLFLTGSLPSKIIAYSEYYNWYYNTLSSNILCAIEANNQELLVSFENGLKLWDKYSGFYDLENPPQTKAIIKSIVKQKNNSLLYCYIPEYQADSMIYIWNGKQWNYIIMKDIVKKGNKLLFSTYYKNNLILINQDNPTILKFIFFNK